MNTTRTRTLALSWMIVAALMAMSANAAAAPSPADSTRVEASRLDRLTLRTNRTRLGPVLIGTQRLARPFADERSSIGQPDYERRYYRRRTIRSSAPITPYRPAATQTRVVVYDDPPVPTRVIRQPPIVLREDYGVSVLLRTTGLSFGDSELSHGNLDGDDVAGFGVALRVGLEPHWGFEFAVDAAGGSSEIAEVTTMPVTFSLLARLFPDSILDLYGLAGLGLHYTRQSYTAIRAADDQYLQAGAHVGGGSELRLGHLLVTGDIRYLVLQAPPRTVPRAAAATAEASGDSRPAIVRDAIRDDIVNGLQFTLGVGYRW